MNLPKLLTQFGLSKNEAIIYSSLVKLLEASAYSLSKETGLPKTSIYEILDDLIAKGLVSKSKVNGASYYSAEGAGKFLATANEKVEIAKLIIPAVQALTSLDKSAPAVKFYTGTEGVKKALNDVLETLKVTGSRKLYGVADQDLKDFLPQFFPSWLARREKMGVFTYLLTHNNGLETEPEMFKSNRLRETRLIPKEHIFSTSMDIYPGKVAFFSSQDNTPHAVIIESEQISLTLQKFFEFMWKSAKISKPSG